MIVSLQVVWYNLTTPFPKVFQGGVAVLGRACDAVDTKNQPGKPIDQNFLMTWKLSRAGPRRGYLRVLARTERASMHHRWHRGSRWSGHADDWAQRARELVCLGTYGQTTSV